MAMKALENRTTLAEFQASLKNTGDYHSHPAHVAPVRRAPGAWTTLIFSLAVARVFPLCAVAEAFRRLTKQRWAEYCFSTVTIAERFGMRVSVEGFASRLAHTGPVMYLANHMSTYETIALPPILLAFGSFSFVAKQSLAHLPALERAADQMGMIGIGRQNPKADLLKLYDVGLKRIARGDSFLVFPQGSRQEEFCESHFSSIGAKLAEKAGIPIVPIAVDTRCQPTRQSGVFKRIFKDFGPVDTSRDIRIAAGPVIPCGNARDMHKASFDWIEGKLKEWGLPTQRKE